MEIDDGKCILFMIFNQYPWFKIGLNFMAPTFHSVAFCISSLFESFHEKWQLEKYSLFLGKAVQKKTCPTETIELQEHRLIQTMAMKMGSIYSTYYAVVVWRCQYLRWNKDTWQPDGNCLDTIQFLNHRIGTRSFFQLDLW